jgi:hypothetical protein
MGMGMRGIYRLGFFIFEGGEETFSHGIVQAIARPAHAGNKTSFGERLDEAVTGILTAAIQLPNVLTGISGRRAASALPTDCASATA